MPERMSERELVAVIATLSMDELRSELRAARLSESALLEQVARLEGAIRWALGEGDSDFPGTEYHGRGQFGWRVKLCRLAALQPKATP